MQEYSNITVISRVRDQRLSFRMKSLTRKRKDKDQTQWDI